MAIGPGSRLGPYQIRSVLGVGGMGEVFLARDTRLGRDVAIKILPAQVVADVDRLRRFETEARATSQLNHPNILTVYDIGAENGQPYVVAERLEGETLRERLLRGPIGEREALELARQIARGLSAAHNRGIIHRDLKPENLFLSRDGQIKILDFGLAKVTAEGSGAATTLDTTYSTEPGTIVGTMQYMAPEQVKGQPVDHRADLFAFGVVLYEMVSGTGPFSRPSGAESMSAVLTETPPPLDEVRAGVSPLIARVVDHCLEKAPDQRFQSARDLVFALESAGTRSISGAGGPSAVAGPPALHRTIPAAVVAAATALTGLGLGWWIGATHAPREEGLNFARVRRFVASDAIEFAPALSPDGKWIAYLSDTPARCDVWVKFLSGGEAANLTATLADLHVARRNDIGGLDISPDGSEIAFSAGPLGAGPTQLSTYVIGAPLGGTPRKLIAGGVGARWSPDGKRLAYVTAGGSAGDALMVSDASGADPRTLVPVAGGVHMHWPAWSADGEYIYVIRGISTQNLEPSEIYRVSVASAQLERVVATSRRAVYPFPAIDGSGLLYSANPVSSELALWWMPLGRNPMRVTTGVGEYSEARLSADKRTMVATTYQDRRSLRVLPIAGDSAMAELTQGSTGDYDPIVSPRGDRLAFSSTRSGNRHIWTSRLDGSDPRELTSGDAVDERPAWSPDGSTIAFVSSRGTSRAIWMVATDGSGLRKILDAQVIDSIAWSPDGTELAYSVPEGAAPAIFRAHVKGGEPVRIPTPGGATSPSWSSTRNLIAYIASSLPKGEVPRAVLGLMTPDGRAVVTPWGDGPRLGNGAVTWSADGQQLAGMSNSGQVESGVWVYRFDGGTPPRQILEIEAKQRGRGIAWLPDSSKLILGMTERSSDIVLFDRGS